jgi:hypothetical protein
MFTLIFSWFLRICNTVRFEFFRVIRWSVFNFPNTRPDFFISPPTEHDRLQYFVWCWGVTWYVYMNSLMILTHTQHHQIRVFKGHGWSVFHFLATHLEFCFFISHPTEHYRFLYFIRCSRVTWYVYLNFFMIFMHLQHQQIWVFQGHGMVGISFSGHTIIFCISPTRKYRLWYFVWCWSVTWYVYMNLFMIFMHLQHRQIRVIKVLGWSVFHLLAAQRNFAFLFLLLRALLILIFFMILRCNTILLKDFYAYATPSNLTFSGSWGGLYFIFWPPLQNFVFYFFYYRALYTSIFCMMFRC